MDIIYFKNGEEGKTPIPKIIYWYALKTNYYGALSAEYCNKVLNNELKNFFEKYPEELHNKVLLDWRGNNNITEEEKQFYENKTKEK